jgi:hypothetical protein
MARSAISFLPMTGRRLCAEMSWRLTWSSMDIGMEENASPNGQTRAENETQATGRHPWRLESAHRLCGRGVAAGVVEPLWAQPLAPSRHRESSGRTRTASLA